MGAVGAITLISAPGPDFTEHDKAYYADANLVNFVRPGLVIKIQSAEIAADGTIKVGFKLTDPKGMPLDREGIVTPGAVSVSFIGAHIPKAATQYVSYVTRAQTSPITKMTAQQAGADSGGTFAKVADGEYTYTFRTKAPASFDKTVTHTIGAYGRRDLSEFDLGTSSDDDVFHFVPDGSPVVTTRDVINTASCNRCHDQLAFHGGTRRSVELCVLCHTPQTVDPDTGNTVNLPVMIHKIHMGKDLPSVQAGGHYQIIGHNQSVADYSEVGFPANARRCEVCHEPDKAAQHTAWLKPSREACGACHDNVNFATGENHVNLPQVSDNQCGSCHVPQGELEYDASVKGAHMIANYSPTLPGLVLDLVKVENGSAGQKPTVTFTLRDKAGNGLQASSFKTAPSGLRLVLTGPTLDYGYSNLGSDVTTAGYVAEDATSASCSADGTCTYTFQHAIPADAKGSFTVGIEGRRAGVLLEGTKAQINTQYGGINKVMHFSVDGSPVAARRQVVSIDKCNQCHSFLSMHGENRNQIEQCVMCHNPGETDKGRRSSAKSESEKNRPPQAINFALMIHKIHKGEHMKEEGGQYTVVGYGGTVHDFTEVRFPALTDSGSPGDLRNCNLCHVNDSQSNLMQWGLNQVTDPQGLLNPVGPITSACTGCHQSLPAASHALVNTTKELGESCAVCHGRNADFSVNRVHAR
jgi:OmcA/MtrC family decaheme c-type cytochrome